MATKKDESVPNNLPQLAFVIHPSQLEFLEKAIEKLDVNRSQWIRELVMQAAGEALGKDPPEVEIKRGGGRADAITDAADAAGMTRQEFMKRAALEALGIKLPKREPSTEPKAKPKKRAKKAA